MPTVKNIIFDGQILQTEAWYRGMGRYIVQVLHHLSELPDRGYKYTLLVNDKIDCDPDRFEVIKYLCPKLNIVHASLPIAKHHSSTQASYKKAINKVIDMEFHDQDNYFVITSLFTFDFFAEYPDSVKKLLIFYDLTPLLLWSDLGAYFPPSLYMSRFKTIFQADKVLTISNTVRDDVLTVFGLESEKVASINGGFSKPSGQINKPASFKVPQNYVLFVSADLPHKNNLVAAEGFNKYILSSKSKTRLVVTSKFSEKSQKELKKVCPSIIFSGNVTDQELEWLYANSEAVLFASKYEGLGIPILDAVYNEKPVIASKIPVFIEMCKNAFYYFDTNNTDKLAIAIKDALAKKDFNSKRLNYAKIMDKYTWTNTANDFIEQVSSTIVANQQTTKQKKRIAVVGVHPGVPGQLGRLAEPLHYWLSKDYAVDYYFDSCGLNYKEIERPTFLDQIGVWVMDIAQLTVHRYKTYAEVVYIVDDLSLQYKTAQVASVLPGLLVHKFSGKAKGTKSLAQSLIKNNAKAEYQVPPITSSGEIYRWLSKQINSNLKDTATEVIIRNGRSNLVIMNKLIRRIKNDK